MVGVAVFASQAPRVIARGTGRRETLLLVRRRNQGGTAIAETIIRDRFQDKAKHVLLEDEFDDYSIAAISKADPLFLVDLRHEGASLLGVSTDAVRARTQRPGRNLSQTLHVRTMLDGIVCMSRITNRECVAVYHQAVSKLETVGPALDLPRLAR